MSRHTDDIYRRWLAQNGSTTPVRRRPGGMGGVPPMGFVAQIRAAAVVGSDDE